MFRIHQQKGPESADPVDREPQNQQWRMVRRLRLGFGVGSR
jgi:hypothetical protein